MTGDSLLYESHYITLGWIYTHLTLH